MVQSFQKVLAATLAIAGTSLAAAAAAHANPASEGDLRITIFETEVSTMFLPQFREPSASEVVRRPYKLTTVLQLDAELGETRDLMFRVQVKRKQFLYLEFRF
jgi:hypothetical protein